MRRESPALLMGRNFNRREQLAFDITVMRAHDLYMDTVHRTLMKQMEHEDELGIGRVLMTLGLLLREG